MHSTRRWLPGQDLRALLLALTALAFAGAATAGSLPETTLEVGGQTLTVEIAADQASQRRGLMYRDHLPADRGMLFVWESSEPRAMWMRNTRIPLDVAFVDGDGVITNIETMQPETTRLHHSAAPVRYALEVNAGWFAEHGVEAGDEIPGVDSAWAERAGETPGSP